MLFRAALLSGLFLGLCSMPASADAYKIIKCTGHNPMDHDISNRYVLNLTKKMWGGGGERVMVNPLVMNGTIWTMEQDPKFPQPPEGDFDSVNMVLLHYGKAARMDITLQCHIDNS
jgi:hypothetical protein